MQSFLIKNSGLLPLILFPISVFIVNKSSEYNYLNHFLREIYYLNFVIF
ncbi:hypothetical protein B0S90_2178 [Caldicellulosiruptor bescii]|uniref:Uncharacterized protein n=1 Tax=Caldicellulosiruptor bescii TaxID=31899 RepID=A0ABY1S7S1_CALBS|nr:hypothetical protein B0S87_2312 [Caldicellulosiruptor bescii]PBC91289.1 hypothetical protein B0S89_1680 [Caldicellulosiruptor bescii]PBD03299.1 hypothetical protein B0S85_0889 [Caldicellulosiruptor bescii]PBD07087.1 hypothetical protein B0S90_2178 [Caldicellulosiruptor bescii]PBD09653.1 hypothetical protein B0S84_2095 [Caldicellulosiruptor bescii]